MRYVYREESSKYAAELIFDALSFEERRLKLAVPLTRVRLTIRQQSANFPKVIELGNVSVPGAPWFRTRIMALIGDTLFVGVDDGLLTIDAATAKILRHLKTGNTEVSQLETNNDLNRVYILNSYYQFESIDGGSNLAAFGLDGTLAWRTPLTDESVSGIKECFTQIMKIDEVNIEANTWVGRCRINADDGSIASCWFTKGS